MSSEPFDPNKIRIEDIFRAKEQRRKELAKLPFEKKIEIVNRLKTMSSKIQRVKKRSKDEAK
jgi:hypothetical protein